MKTEKELSMEDTFAASVGLVELEDTYEDVAPVTLVELEDTYDEDVAPVGLVKLEDTFDDVASAGLLVLEFGELAATSLAQVLVVVVVGGNPILESVDWDGALFVE